MAVNLSPVFGVAGQLFNDNGDPLAGGKIYTYLAGTTTPTPTYTSASGAIAHSNPIVLDGAGRVPSGEIWLTDGIQYKFVVEDAASNLIGTYDNISGINSNFVNFTNQQEIQTATAGQTVFNLATMQYQPGTNSLSVFVDGVNQYGPGAQYAYVETDNDTVTFVNGLHVGALVKFTTSQINTSANGDAFQVSYTAPYTGAVNTNVGQALSHFINVLDFGADPTGSADSTTAFTDAYTAALNNGVGVYVPNGTYKILDSSNFAGQSYPLNKPINIWTGQDVTYIGNVVLGVYPSIPCFGASVINGYNLNNYTYLYSEPNQAIEDPGAPGQYPFGTATLSVDSIPGTGYRGNANAGFFEIIGVNGADFALGGINIVSAMRSGFLGNANCMELDLENSAADGKGLGIVLTGQGTFKPEVAHKVLRFPFQNQSPTGAGGNWIPPWQFGVQIYNSEVGVFIDQSGVQTPSTALFINPGPQAVGTNKAIIVEDPNSTAIFAVQNDGYIDYRSAGPITSFGTNAIGLSAPQAPNVYLMSDKTVRLAGHITATTGNTISSGATLATIPAGFRPNRNIILPGMTSNGIAIYFEISTAGVITCNTNVTSAFAVTLDSIVYLLNN